MAGLKMGVLQWPAVLGWRLRRAWLRGQRRLGIDGLAVLLGLLLAAVLVVALEQARGRQAQQALRAKAATPALRPTEPTQPVRSNLARFEDVLLPHEDIPDALDEIFELASAEKLVLVKGEYRLQVDDSGRFVRYRMALPVRGNARSLQRFIEHALVDHPSLAFESVQLKREHIQSDRVEAQIQWTLLTKLPSSASASAKATP